MVLLPASTFAAKSVTDVSGTVTYNGSPAAGAKVTVTCDSTSKNTTTASDGTYLVQFNATKCPSGANVSVNATKTVTTGTGKKKNKHTVTGMNNGTVNNAGTDRVNVAIIPNIVLLPEFGFVTAAGATIIGGGSLLAIRRRSLNSTKV